MKLIQKHHLTYTNVSSDQTRIAVVVETFIWCGEPDALEEYDLTQLEKVNSFELLSVLCHFLGDFKEVAIKKFIGNEMSWEELQIILNRQ